MRLRCIGRDGPDSSDGLTVWHGRNLYGCNPGWQADADADLANIPNVPDGGRDLISDENVSTLHRAVRLILPTNSSPNQGRGLVYLAHVEYSLVYIYWSSFVCADFAPGGLHPSSSGYIIAHHTWLRFGVPPYIPSSTAN